MLFRSYDRELMRLASEDSGICVEMFANADEEVKNSILYKVSKKVYNGELIPPESNDFTSDQNLFNYQAKVLKELAKNESYVVIGRAADHILKGSSKVYSIYLYAEEEDCIARIEDMKCFTKKEAVKYIKKMDRYRKDYYKYHTGKEWEDPTNYDLCINTSELGYTNCVKLIQEYVKLRTI